MVWPRTGRIGCKQIRFISSKEKFHTGEDIMKVISKKNPYKMKMKVN